MDIFRTLNQVNSIIYSVVRFIVLDIQTILFRILVVFEFQMYGSKNSGIGDFVRILFLKTKIFEGVIEIFFSLEHTYGSGLVSGNPLIPALTSQKFLCLVGFYV